MKDKNTNTIHPLSYEEFNSLAKNNNRLNIGDFKAYFRSQINEAANYAIGPYYWFIGDNYNLKITVVSDNIGNLTPFTQKEWTNAPSSFLMENIHPDECFYVLSAISIAIAKIEELPSSRQSKVRVNIYTRMLNANREYRWVLMQMPGLYIDNSTRSNCALMLVTDLSHLRFTSRPVLMTLTDKVNNQNQYYHMSTDVTKLVSVELPQITSREQEILKWMAKGLTTPEIAKKLFISYHTVENHKRNMRVKTNVKTSAELMSYIINNNLI